jgi:hypothetical protein
VAKKTKEKVSGLGIGKLKETQKLINGDSWVTALLGIYCMNPYKYERMPFATARSKLG